MIRVDRQLDSRARSALLLLLPLLWVPATSAAEPGLPSEDRRAAEEWLGLTEQSLTEEERSLLRRPDEKRPSEQFSTDLFGRRLFLGWSYESRAAIAKDIPFKDQRVDDRTRVSQRLRADLFYRLTESTSIFLRGSGFYRSKWREFEDHPLGLDDGRNRERGLARDETWVFVRDLADTPLSLQVGRQRFFEEREWWWDENLDAIRMHFDLPNLHVEVGVSRLLGRVSTDEPHIDPEEEDVVRLLARATWEWTDRNQLELFLLRQWDGSDDDPVGALVNPSREDESDASLLWVGASAGGRRKFDSSGAFNYWVDTALVDGRETFFDYTGTSTNRRVDSRTRHGVHGWAVDAGVTWKTLLPGRPALTLGYAFGSGDRKGKNLARKDDQKANDRSFRQTGLQDNNDRFRGVDRFRYYGELLDPELSNLHVGTAGLGLRFFEESSVELVYHFYRQDEPAKFLRDSEIRRQPAGRKRGIGQEIDLVIGIEEWKHVELEFILAAFRAGPAFAAHCDDEDGCLEKNDRNFVPAVEGDWSYLAFAKVVLNF